MGGHKSKLIRAKLYGIVNYSYILFFCYFLIIKVRDIFSIGIFVLLYIFNTVRPDKYVIDNN